MMYYGVILSLIRKPQKVKDADGSKIANAKIETSEDAFVVTDKLFFVLYTVLFLLFRLGCGIDTKTIKTFYLQLELIVKP